MSCSTGVKVCLALLLTMLAVALAVAILYFNEAFTRGNTEQSTPGPKASPAVKLELPLKACTTENMLLPCGNSSVKNTIWYREDPSGKKWRGVPFTWRHTKKHGGLLVKDLTLSETGYWLCTDSETHQKHRVFLRVMDCRNVSVCPGSDITMNCSAADIVSNPANPDSYSIYWFYYNGSLPKAARKPMRVASDGRVFPNMTDSLRGRLNATLKSLAVRDVTEIDSGKYMCQVMAYGVGGTTRNRQSFVTLGVKRVQDSAECKVSSTEGAGMTISATATKPTPTVVTAPTATKVTPIAVTTPTAAASTPTVTTTPRATEAYPTLDVSNATPGVVAAVNSTANHALFDQRKAVVISLVWLVMTQF